MDIKQQLSGEFDARLEELGDMQLGDDNYRTATDCMTKVADRIIEIEKIEAECKLKEQQLKIDRRDKIVRNVIEGVKVVGGLGSAFAIAIISINFEREGTFTTQAGRSTISQLLKFKN